MSESDFTGFEDRGGGYGDSWRKDYAFQKLDFSVRDPKSVLDEFQSIFNFLQGVYQPYPYPKMSAVMMPLLSWYGQGAPTMLTLDGTSFIADGEKARYDWFFQVMGQDWGPKFWAHESGHQYWGNYVGWRQPRDQWLSEAFTEQQSAMYMQASRGGDWYQMGLEEWRYHALKYDKDGPISLGGQRLGDAYTALTYAKGPYVVHMIRMMIGDKAFMTWEKNVLKSMMWKNPTTSDFVQVLEQTLGKENMLALFGTDNMQWFFDQWVYGTGVPSYEYGYELSGNTAKVKIKHIGPEKAGEHAGENFRVRIPVWVYPESGDKYAIPVLLTGEKPIEEFDLTLRGPAKKLVLDEFGAVLTKNIKEVKYKKIE